MDAIPTRPRDVIDTPGGLKRLVAAYDAHTDALFDNRHGLADHPLTAEEHGAHVVAVLAYAAAIAERAQQPRWVHAREALSVGVTGERVAAAMGLSWPEVARELARWAEEQRRFGLITDDEHAAVLALIGAAS